MVTYCHTLVTECLNPHQNLAFEELLLQNCSHNTVTMYLWRNAHTVVIGAGQNAFSECRVRLLQEEGVTLARRSSGGGAVYHDLGNLNFSFILPRADYDVSRQLRVVLEAVRAHGIDCEPTGRNDLTAGGRKFSGNAFRLTKDAALHHGTLLISADMNRIGRYLNVSEDKLKAKGVKSVPSRVINLSELGNVTIESMKREMIRAFSREYGEGPVIDADERNYEGLAEKTAEYASWEHVYGASPAGETRLRRRFPWGEVDVYADILCGRAQNVSVFTDAMDETLAPRLRAALTGCAWEAAPLAARAREIGCEGVAAWLMESV